MGSLELFRLDADHACRYALDGNELLILVQPESFGRRVGQYEIQHECPRHSDGSEDVKDHRPVGDGNTFGTLADTGRDEATDDSLPSQWTLICAIMWGRAPRPSAEYQSV